MMNRFMKKIKNKYHLLTLLFLSLILVVSNVTYFITYGDQIIEFTDDPDYMESQVLGNVVYVNDLEADYYYYMGLNYTDNDGRIPTVDNKNVYNENNLVQVKISYSGHDESGLVGYVSTSERQDTYIYFKTIAVLNNGTPNDLTDDYIDIVLIDNPFTDRPTDSGFNGWVTDYSGAYIYYDSNYYERHVKIPVTYTDNIPDKIEINFNASWADAKVYMTNGSFNSVLTNLNTKGMKQIELVIIEYEYKSMRGYYKQVLISNGSRLRGYYSDTGRQYGNWDYCTNRSDSWNGSECVVYSLINTDEDYDASVTYYTLVSGNMTEVDPDDLNLVISSTTVVDKYNDLNMSGYYRKHTITNGVSQDGYYDFYGNLLSGNCGSDSCDVYELIQYYDEDGNANIFSEDIDYYYLVTRDTNIVVVNSSISGTWSSNTNYPFTVTGIHNGTDYGSVWTTSSAINCYEDIVIENVELRNNGNMSNTTQYSPPTGSSTAGVLFARYNNVKLGRGIKINDSYYSLRSVVGGSGSSTGSNNNPTKYKIVIESGKYNSISLSGGAQTGTGGNALYLNNKSVYGNDYDRVNVTNDNLDLVFCAAGSWSGSVYGSTNSTSSSDVIFDLIVKSGTFGSGKSDLTTGIYIGGRYGGTQYAVRQAKIEGGYIYNLIGGPISSSNRSEYNDIYAYMTGGEVDMITAGAGTSATYGNRIVQVTGGTVNYSVFGGSNGQDGSTGDGTLNGSTYVYIGGNATIGKEDYVNGGNTLWGAESGSVFGNGNGNTTASSIGSCSNSTIVIDESAVINGNIYGGGNYGATGVSSTDNSSSTTIVINDGLIKGSVYGGGNQNGSGSATKTASIDILMHNGVVVGSIYGGSNVEGTVYGDVSVTVDGGEITNSIYGGGRGGITASSDGTYVLGNVLVTVGEEENNYTPIINGAVYGGSAFGTVNGTTNSSDVSSSKTNIVINKGIITNVFGGGQGNSSYTPYVLGDIKVVVNNGNIDNVFGGNDKSGIPNGKIEVFINGGTIENTYGGGNETSAHQTNVYLQGGTSFKIFGGSNLLGDVDESNVRITSGEVTTVYGGNNQGGTTDTTNVLVNGGNVENVYGGGEATSVGTSTNVTINSQVSNVYGGSNVSGDVPITNIDINDAFITNTYGGNNQGGVTTTSNINIYGGVLDSVYGGGLMANTGTTNIFAHYGYINNLYGGGSEAGATDTNVNLGNANINNLYGGSNVSGDVDNSYVKSITNTIDNLVDIDISYGESSQHNSSDTSYTSSQNMIVNITNKGSSTIQTWDLYILTSDGFIGANWSSASISEIDNGYHINEINQYYGTNTIGVNGSLSFDFHIHSYVEYDKFLIYGYYFIGYDSNGDEYVTKLEVNNLYGGNNKGGSTETSHIDLTDGTINNLYGGGKQADGTYTNIDIDGVTVNYAIFGGGDEAKVDTVSMNIDNCLVGLNDNDGYIYGGGNKASVYSKINLTMGNNTKVNGYVYGGGNLGEVLGIIEANISDIEVTKNIYGGGNKASVGSDTVEGTAVTLSISNSIASSVYGGGNEASVNGDIYLNVTSQSNILDSIYGGGNLGEVLGVAETEIADSIIGGSIYGAGNKATVGVEENSDATSLTVTNTTATTIYGGGNAAATKGNTRTIISNSTVDDAIYGGGNGTTSVVSDDEDGLLNPAKVLGNTNLTVDGSTVGNVYGAGNLGMVNGSTNVKTNQSTILNSIYGGGNAAKVLGDTYLYVSASDISNSIYAGGNGTTAIVYGNTNLDIDNATSVINHVFGGGNAAATGTAEEDNSTGIVNIAGATIGKNVYGGANTSVLYGVTTVNIGKNVITNKNLIATDISIGGTVFGGGEANASGSEIYDFNFISITQGININIDAEDHNITITGSIFGSGNASSTSGYSYVNIKNYGTLDDIKRNISIQRANVVTLDNSYLELSGATDRTNEYSDVLFTLSRIDELKLKNSSSLYLKTGANLLKKFSSVVDVDGVETKASVNIDDENETFTRNVNNRIYMLSGDSKNLNIAKNESVTEYGDVSGMTFFGLYAVDKNGNIITALYDDYQYSETVSAGDIYYFTTGSYVLGKHLANHDIEVDGFYSNYGDSEGTKIIVKYIEPTPADSAFYMWSIGEVVASYDISLIASKYATLGTKEVPLLNHATPNTTFSILGVNYSELDSEIQLVDYSEIPRVASSTQEADTIFGLNIKTGQTGWLTDGSTNFITNGDVEITGTRDYVRENSNNVPTLVFYLYHSKNLATSGNMGKVTISLVAITPIDDLNNEVERININVDLSRDFRNTNEYEGTITPGKKYEMFATSNVNITAKSSFSAYYSLFIDSSTNPYKTGYYRSIVSSYVFPVNTKITMIDLHDEDNPTYYYYVIDEDAYDLAVDEFSHYGESSYKLSNFVKMGSTSLDNNYDDEYYNNYYYQNEIAEEEFIFMVDFKDANIQSNVLDKSLLIELRNADDQTLINVLGIEAQTLKYNLYIDSDAEIDLEGSFSKNPVYLGNSTNLTINANFVQQVYRDTTIYDTTFDNEKLGIKLSIYDSRGNLLSAQDLMGISFNYAGNTYYPRYDGTTRIKVADKVANAKVKITIDTGTSKLSTDEYVVLVEAFGSYDGIYYGPVVTNRLEMNLKIIDTLYGLSCKVVDELMFIDKVSGYTLNNNNVYVFLVNYESQFDNANLRIKLQRRDYSSIYNNIYHDVDLLEYVSDNLNNSNNLYEYILSNSPASNTNYYLHFKENLTTGTYRIVISLYDNNNYIGDVYQYLIIK